MAHFHTLTVKDIRNETDDCISIAFDIPENLTKDFEYTHGQYLTLKVKVNGEEVRRSYSICSSPVSGEPLRIAVKQVDNGRASTFLNKTLQQGAKLEVMPPMGNFFTQLDSKNKKQYVGIAAGSGITPIMSILKTVLHHEPESTFTLFYGNREELSIIFREELVNIRDKYHGRFKIHHLLSRDENADKQNRGRLTGEKIKALASEYLDAKIDSEFFMCGPEPMIVNVSEGLEEIGVPKAKIHVELFSAPVTSAEKNTVKASAGTSGACMVTVIMDGEEIEFPLETSGESILDAALENDVDVPFACKGAVCCTCKAKVIEGTVEMEMNFALSEEEVEEGFILTCQAHPTSPKVVVDYDAM
ncbi:MAG: ring-1,2-phenylacetyl-CoA epoxidase subunit PaaE [Sphingobacteriales bacterium]|jgi:ring-1,2-phenylacetyl-CoA epoxidase subunit PaaE